MMFKAKIFLTSPSLTNSNAFQIVDKFESDKNVISRELATQTQKVVEAKLTIQQLHKLNTQLKSDLQVCEREIVVVMT